MKILSVPSEKLPEARTQPRNDSVSLQERLQKTAQYGELPARPGEGEDQTTVGSEVQIGNIKTKSDFAPAKRRGARRARPLLLLSDDEMLWLKLLRAGSPVGRRVVRGRLAADGPQALRFVKPAAVLLDLELPELRAWQAADSLLEHENCPPLILLTARGKQSDFDTAVQAGCLIDKGADPGRMLELVELRLAKPKTSGHELNAMQRIVIRWLKPCGWPILVAPLNRFWGINE